jgi:hypothetical protein
LGTWKKSPSLEGACPKISSLRLQFSCWSALVTLLSSIALVVGRTDSVSNSLNCSK